MTSGDPRKQPRPDGQEPTDQVTKAFPPSLSMVMTEVETSVVPFAFPGGKGLQMTCRSGDLAVNVVFPPQAAEVVIDALRQAKIKADTGLEVAGADALHSLNGNGAKAG